MYVHMFGFKLTHKSNVVIGGEGAKIWGHIVGFAKWLNLMGPGK